MSETVLPTWNYTAVRWAKLYAAIDAVWTCVDWETSLEGPAFWSAVADAFEIQLDTFKLEGLQTYYERPAVVGLLEGG